MRDYLVIGSTPAEEDCAQVGSPDYKTRMIKEINAFINQLLRQFGPEPKGAEIRVKGFPHDFGTYHEVVVFFDDNNEEAVNYAYKIENEAATRWDEEALIELGLKKNPKVREVMARKYTNKLYEMVEEGLLDKDTVIIACLKYMSEDEVRDMMEINEFLTSEDQNEREE